MKGFQAAAISAVFLFLLAASFEAPHARASLGEGAESIERDRSALNGNTQKTVKDSYSVQEIDAGRRKVREFLRQDGTVFAVSWRGPVPPDLGVLLGKYYDEYRNARGEPPAEIKRGERTTRSDHAIVQEGGHMRDVQGRAYVPGLVPPGVDIAEVR
jgi:hypothetical protein